MSDSDSRFDRRTVLKGLGGAAAVGAVGVGAFATSGAASASIDININDTHISNDEGKVNFLGVDLNKTINWDAFDVPVRYIGFKHEIALEENNNGWHLLYGDETQDGNFNVSARLPNGWFIDGNGTPRESGDYGSSDEYITSYTGDKTDGTEGGINAGVTWEIINDTGEPGSYPEFGYDGGGPQDPAQWASDLSVPKDLESKDNVKERTVRWKTTLRFYTEGTGGAPVPITEDDGEPEVVGEERFTVTVTNEVGDVAVSSGGDSTAG